MRLLSCPCEFGHVLPEGLIAGAGTVIWDTAQVRSGTKALKFPGSDAYVSSNVIGTGTSGRAYRLRLYCYIDSSGTINSGLCLGGLYETNPTSGFIMITADPANGNWGLYDNIVGTPVNTGVPFTRGVWNRLELTVIINSGGSDTIQLHVNGSLAHSNTAADLGSTMLQGFFLGDPTTFFSETVPYWISDVALNDDQGALQNGLPGAGHVDAMWWASDNAVGSGWLEPGGGSPIGDATDQAPPTGVAHTTGAGGVGRQIYNVTSTAVANYDANLETYAAAGIASFDVVNLVQAVLVTGSNNATNTAGAVRVVSNPAQGSEDSFTTFDNGIAGAFPTNWLRVPGSVLYAPSVVVGSAPVLRVGKRTATTRAALVAMMALIVDWTEGVPTTGVPLQRRDRMRRSPLVRM